MLAVYWSTTMVTAFIQATFIPIAVPVANIYGVKSIIVNNCVSFFFISYVLFNFSSVQALEKLGSGITFKVCSFCLILGSWARYFTMAKQDNFVYILIPQGFMAIFQPAMSCGISKLATNWFGDDERALATNLGTLSNPAGILLGFILGSVFVSNGDDSNPEVGK